MPEIIEACIMPEPICVVSFTTAVADDVPPVIVSCTLIVPVTEAPPLPPVMVILSARETLATPLSGHAVTSSMVSVVVV